MKDIPDRSIDLILCDLPYNSTQNSWDSLIPFDKLWAQYKRIRKENAACVFTASQPFTSSLGASNIAELRYSWIWQKNNATGHLNAKRMPMKDYEDILVFYKKQPTYNPQGLIPYNKITRRGNNGDNFGESGKENLQEFTNYPRMCLKMTHDKSKLHPTQKPIALMEYLIKTYTNEGYIVLDNCAGSGTSLVAAKNLNRQYIGIEKEEKYYNVITERLKA